VKKQSIPSFNPATVRDGFPSLARTQEGRTVVFADGPGGTQMPRSVSEVMSGYLQHSNANTGGVFLTSREPVAVVNASRTAMAAFLNATPEEIIFGQNMTSLTFSMSRALARTWQPGDEIIVTGLDHDANVAPWMLAAEDRGAIVNVLPFDPGECLITPAVLAAALGPRTRLVALGYASNAVGSILDLAPMIAQAHAAGALVYIDAVHFAPHGVIDVRALDCDFLACSAYKFCGPHLGILYGRSSLLESLKAYKVRPSTMQPPGKWETGTQNFEAIAGLGACLGYLGGIASLEHPLSRPALVAAMQGIQAYEQLLSRRFLAGAATIPGLRLYGISDPARLAHRTPTFGLTLAGCPPRRAAERLAEQGIFVWDGHFYAQGFVEQLDLASRGGVIRIGFAHYNTLSEVDRVVDALAVLARQS
jgi:cysteine desulfurase family protein (TIGR01976 family)